MLMPITETGAILQSLNKYISNLTILIEDYKSRGQDTNYLEGMKDAQKSIRDAILRGTYKRIATRQNHREANR